MNSMFMILELMLSIFLEKKPKKIMKIPVFLLLKPIKMKLR